LGGRTNGRASDGGGSSSPSCFSLVAEQAHVLG
jgi:hypothetical protein